MGKQTFVYAEIAKQASAVFSNNHIYEKRETEEDKRVIQEDDPCPTDDF